MRNLAANALDLLASEWGARLRREANRYPAQDIYGGRGFREAASTAEGLDARLMVVSAGVGLVDAVDKIPPYACTILADAADGVAAKTEGAFVTTEWWTAVRAASPFAVSFQEAFGSGKTLILAALSDAYISMISEELLALPEESLSRLRLFTRAPIERVPTRLRPFVMPYDDRLDGPDSVIQGTRSDFAGRALRHFATAILVGEDDRSASEHAKAITSAIRGWRMPAKVQRIRHDDKAMLNLIRAHWHDAAGCTLRRFRDEFNIACEQSRFRDLANVVRAEQV